MNIEFREDHAKEDSQLFIAISGSSKFIREKLREISAEADKHKPFQGRYIEAAGMQEIITPKWDGQNY